SHVTAQWSLLLGCWLRLFRAKRRRGSNEFGWRNFRRFRGIGHAFRVRPEVIIAADGRENVVQIINLNNWRSDRAVSLNDGAVITKASIGKTLCFANFAGALAVVLFARFDLLSLLARHDVEQRNVRVGVAGLAQR